MSLSPVGASLSLVGPSLHLTPVRRCCRIGSGRARALCQCCLTWAILSWRRLSSARVLLCQKFSYVIRTCPPSHVNGAAKEFDWVMPEAPQSIIGGPLSEWSWLKASLPSSRGGINLRSASCCLPGLLVCLPDTGGEDAWAWSRPLPPHQLLHGCPLCCCISSWLGGFGWDWPAFTPALPLCPHWWGRLSTAPIICFLHRVPCSLPLLCTAPCWWLAKRRTICCPGPPPPRPGVPLLPEVMAGHEKYSGMQCFEGWTGILMRQLQKAKSSSYSREQLSKALAPQWISSTLTLIQRGCRPAFPHTAVMPGTKTYSRYTNTKTSHYTHVL